MDYPTYSDELAIPVDPESVTHFVLVRDPLVHYKFNIVALDAENEVVYVHSLGHIFDTGSELVNVLNSELQPV